jgi:hypothetical protein
LDGVADAECTGAENTRRAAADAARANSQERAPAGSPIAISPAKAREFVMAYEALRQTLQHQVEDQMRMGNMKFVRNCDGVLAKFRSGRLDYHSPEK